MNSLFCVLHSDPLSSQVRKHFGLPVLSGPRLDGSNCRSVPGDHLTGPPHGTPQPGNLEGYGGTLYLLTGRCLVINYN